VSARVMRRGGLALALLLGVVGCKGSTEPTVQSEPAPVRAAEPRGTQTVATTPPVTIDFDRRGAEGARTAELPAAEELAPVAFCPSYSGVVCRKIFACAEPESIAVDAEAQGFSDEATCRAALMRFCTGLLLPGVVESVAEGRVRWDGAGFKRCFAGWVALGCEAPLGDLPDRPECRDSAVGTVEVGALCGSAFDCAKADGEERVCAFDEEGHGVCERLKGPGEVCDLVKGECREGLVCRGERCQAPGGIGEVCLFDADCQAGLACPDKQCARLFPR